MMNVVTADVGDAEDILALQKQAYLSEAVLNADADIPPLTQTLPELQREFQRKHIIKIEQHGRIIASGQAYLQDDTCYIGRMSVLPALQGQGIGSHILAALEQYFGQARRYELFTGERSIANLAMYQRRGYLPFKTAKLGKTTIVFLEKIIIDMV